MSRLEKRFTIARNFRVVPVDLQRVHAATAASERRKKLDVPEFECRAFRNKKNKARLYQTPRNRKIRR